MREAYSRRTSDRELYTTDRDALEDTRSTDDRLQRRIQRQVECALAPDGPKPTTPRRVIQTTSVLSVRSRRRRLRSPNPTFPERSAVVAVSRSTGHSTVLGTTASNARFASASRASDPDAESDPEQFDGEEAFWPSRDALFDLRGVSRGDGVLDGGCPGRRSELRDRDGSRRVRSRSTRGRGPPEIVSGYGYTANAGRRRRTRVAIRRS